MAVDRKKPQKTASDAPPAEAKPLLTIEAVAELIDSTPDQIRNMRSRGQMPADLGVVIPGFGLRFRAAKLRAWLATLAGEAVPA